MEYIVGGIVLRTFGVLRGDGDDQSREVCQGTVQKRDLLLVVELLGSCSLVGHLLSLPKSASFQ